MRVLLTADAPDATVSKGAADAAFDGERPGARAALRGASVRRGRAGSARVAARQDIAGS
jgi:hypothetical protein